jgi:hypothetical protein
VVWRKLGEIMWQTPYWLALALWGGLVILGSLGVLFLVLFIPRNPHSGYIGMVFLFIVVGRGLTYGISQIREAMKEKHSAAQETRSE